MLRLFMKLKRACINHKDTNNIKQAQGSSMNDKLFLLYFRVFVVNFDLIWH